MKTWRRWILAVSLSLILCFVLPSTAFIEGEPSSPDGFFTVSLESLSDDELAEVAAAIRAEQRARIKTHIIFDSNDLILSIGKSQKVNVTIEELPEGEKTPKLEWETVDKSIASCKNGTVKAVGAGKTTMICSATLADGTQIEAECSVTVIVPVSSISTDKKAITIDVTKSVIPSFTLKPDNATNTGLKFSSSDPSIASVDSEGKITGNKSGKATVTIEAMDGSGKTTSISVTVEDNRGSIGKRTAAIKGSTAKKMCEYISKEFTSLSNIINSKRNGPLIAESLIALLQNADKGFVSNMSCFMGLSKDDMRKMYIACGDTSGQYWMIMFEPDRNNMTYSKDTKSREDAIAFMEFNCSSYKNITVR